MFYDFHIHSCLSPCSNDDMTPNNIAQMAMLKGLNYIAICDHNSMKQQDVFKKVCDTIGIKMMYGVEIQTSEEVHVCCYFLKQEDCKEFQLWIDSKTNHVKNNEQFFGKQILCNEFDQVIGYEEYLLINSLNASLNETITQVHTCHGKAVLAHVLDRVNSVTHQLGFIPEDCEFDGLEVKNLNQMITVKEKHPWMKETTWFINSDAHQLIDISEPENAMSLNEFELFWGKTL
ncbi:PHP domain-containing protein [Anaerorhabdus sp.]|uniref:PHP domain-containing protein n=1 Tax=Anaerorhabdus sp. TaxID=1872524 RepID=UPI002FCAE7AB